MPKAIGTFKNSTITDAVERLSWQLWNSQNAPTAECDWIVEMLNPREDQ
jgi:hypothetical protein